MRRGIERFDARFHPPQHDHARQRDEEMKKLQRDLRKAVTEEKYEVAAGLRDKIQQLETGSGGVS